MLKIIFFYVLITSVFANSLYSKFHQSDYKIDFQRIELTSYEKSVFNFIKLQTSKFNRTTPVVNATFNAKKDLGVGLEVVVQLYKFMSNQYRMFPTRFQMNLCKALNEDIIGVRNMYNCGNLKTCEVLKNTTYNVCNFYTDESRFPPFVPNGEYKARCQFLNDEEEAVVIDYYLKIYRPLKS